MRHRVKRKRKRRADDRTEDWRLFIDSSKTNLNTVLLKNGNDVPFIPLACSTKMKETHNDLREILMKINYEAFKWKICTDLKVVAVLMGLQAGYTKYCCFVCE